MTEVREILTQGNSIKINVTFTIKSVQNGCVSEIIRSFDEQLIKFKVHHFNIRHQYNQYRLLKKEMSASEVLIHIYYSRELSSEIV